MSRLIRTYTLPAAVMHEYGGYVHTVLADGSENHYHPPCWSLDYLRAAQEMGYSDPMRYTVEHEIAHHLVADKAPVSGSRCLFDPVTPGPKHPPAYGAGRCWIFSRIIYRACHNLPMSMEEPESAAEEHLVNRLQRYANLGQADPYGELERVFGERLPAVAAHLLGIARPWLKAERAA